tara:strand:- start:1502 stop:2185 length:684 start_codon:yes stop_codon:yes gene_type:complete
MIGVKMKVSSQTLSVLKNFSEINENILVKPGNTITTISTLKNVLAQATIDERFEQEFGIYKLPEFLRSVELFEKPELNFNGGQYVTIKDEKYGQSIKYFFADSSVLVTPSRTIELPDRYVTFQFTKEKFERLMKGANSLQLPDIALKGADGKLTITASDKKNKSSNEYSVSLGDTDKNFTVFFRMENFKQIEDDYDVAISEKGLAHFIGRNRQVQYWIAVEKDSVFN